MKIGIDFDNILSNTTCTYLDLFNKLVSTNYTINDIRDWDMRKVLPEKYKYLIETLWRYRELWENIKPLSESQVYVNLLAKEHEVYIVTATDLQVADYKFSWLWKNYPFLDKDKVIITKYKQLIDLDVLIDDYQGNLIGGKYKGILFTYPWNEDFNAEQNNIIRVRNWTEAYKAIQSI